MENKSSNTLLAIILLAILSVIWGSSFMLMKLGLDSFTPLEVAALRLAIAGLLLSPFLFKYVKEIPTKKILLLVAIGLTGSGLPAFLFPTAEQVVPTAVAGVLNAMTPIFTVIIAALFFSTRFPLIKVIGIFIGLGGTVLLMSAGGMDIEAGSDMGIGIYIQYCGLIVLATIFYALSVNFSKTYFQDTNPIGITAISLFSMAVPSVIYLLSNSHFLETMETHPKAWESFTYVALLGALGTALALVLFYRLLQISNLIIASSVTYTIPVIAVLWGVFYLHEPLNWQHFLGFGVILAGVWVVNMKRK